MRHISRDLYYFCVCLSLPNFEGYYGRDEVEAVKNSCQCGVVSVAVGIILTVASIIEAALCPV